MTHYTRWDRHLGLKFFLTLVLTVVATITVIGSLIAFAHYHEFKNG